MRTVYMYEDDYCMCEVLPEACFYYCAEQIEKIKEFSENEEQDNVYVIPPPEQSIKDLKINKDKITECFADFVLSYDVIESPIIEENHLQDGSQVLAFGNNERANIFFSIEKETDYVQRIWAVFTPQCDADKEEAEKIFSSLEKVGEFLYVDYFTDSLFSLSEKAGKKKYINDLTGWFLKQQRLAESQRCSS